MSAIRFKIVNDIKTSVNLYENGDINREELDEKIDRHFNDLYAFFSRESFLKELEGMSTEKRTVWNYILKQLSYKN